MCNKMGCSRIEDGTRYCAARQHDRDAEDIKRGISNPIAACNLLAAIECGDASLDTLPVKIEEIEGVAGRKMRVIMNSPRMG